MCTSGGKGDNENEAYIWPEKNKAISGVPYSALYLAVHTRLIFIYSY